MNDALDLAKQTNIVELVSHYTKMRHVSGQEYAGACPKCQGEDRFHATKEWWFCRQCSPKRGDAPGFLQFVAGLPFTEAVERLSGEKPSGNSFGGADRRERLRQTMLRQSQGRVPVSTAPAVKEQAADWYRQAVTIVTNAHENLMDGDNEGARYLQSRGLLPVTWEAYNFGYGQAYSREADTHLPAIVIPWHRGGKICAIRYRFLNPVGGQKTSSLKESNFSGVLFGGQSALGCAERLRTLILCEGELNAASIWQVAHYAHVDVLSIGSETSMLTPKAVEYIGQFRQVIVWMDRAEIARQLMAVLPRAVAFNSPDGKDANDLHRAGMLGGVLATLRCRGAKTHDAKESIVWDYWDARHDGYGDAGADRVAAELATGIGKVYG